MIKRALKWLSKERHYVPYELPEGASCYESDMEKEIACCICGKKLPFGECYTSRRIHTPHGFGYAECGECYSEYQKQRWKEDIDEK